MLFYLQTLSLEKIYVFNMAMALAVYDTIKEFLPQSDVKIKWPNDVYVQDKKVSGILVEHIWMQNKLSNTIVGVGLNINQTIFPKDLPNPASIKTFLNTSLDINHVNEKLVVLLKKRYTQVKLNALNEIIVEYHACLYKHKEWMHFKTKDEVFTGMIQHVDERGNLHIMDAQNNIFVFGFKEVEYLV